MVVVLMVKVGEVPWVKVGQQQWTRLPRKGESVFLPGQHAYVLPSEVDMLTVAGVLFPIGRLPIVMLRGGRLKPEQLQAAGFKRAEDVS